MSRKALKGWLKSHDTYTRYMLIVTRHDYRQTYVKYPGEKIIIIIIIVFY